MPAAMIKVSTYRNGFEGSACLGQRPLVGMMSEIAAVAFVGAAVLLMEDLKQIYNMVELVEHRMSAT